MSRGKATRENVELAFDIYCAKGGNVAQTMVELERRGLRLSRPTLDSWVGKYDFERRRIQVEEERQRLADTQKTFEAQVLDSLIKRKEQYETYFETSDKPAPDSYAMTAYVALLKTIVDIKAKVGAYKSALFLDFMRDLIDWLSRNAPEAVPVIEGIFDEFISHAREKYGA